MKIFRFRLQKVLDYREAMELWAQEAYLETRVARLEAEAAEAEVHLRREEILSRGAQTLDDRRALENCLQRLDEEQKEKQMVLDVLRGEEDKALKVWHEKKQDLEAMVKLRDKALEDWQLESNRKEQAELDEWSVLKRKGA